MIKAVDDVTFDISAGTTMGLVGESGCGKTTLLNIISGLLTPSEGRVLYDNKDVTALPPEKRNIAQVFQFPVLYDTMTVFDNLAFPLKNRGFRMDDITPRVHEIADILDLTPFLNKRAAGLTADAKQKISLGRGLVGECKGRVGEGEDHAAVADVVAVGLAILHGQRHRRRAGADGVERHAEPFRGIVARPHGGGALLGAFLVADRHRRHRRRHRHPYPDRTLDMVASLIRPVR